jgi:N-acetylglucosaminyldiphosphoundecaprenol N-acetyl-beta-D-mannosaminyltransferase
VKERLKILNIWVDPYTRSEAIARVEAFMAGNKVYTIFAANPEKNYSVPADPDLYEAYRKADLLIPDGMGIVLAARLLHRVKLNRIPGVEFMGQICRLAARKRKSVFLFGANEAVNEAAAKKLEKIYPELKVVGRSNGYVSDDDMDVLVKKINQSSAEVLFIALGSPKQEKWFAKFGPKLEHVRVCQGIGGSLDVLVGKVRRAPDIWIKISAEWLYRLLSEPVRIKRQKVLPVFVFAVAITMVKKTLKMS